MMKSLFKHLKAIAQYPQPPISIKQVQALLSSGHSSLPLVLKLLVFLPVLLTLRPTPVKAVIGTGTFGSRYAADLRGDIVLIGNTLTTCTVNTACTNLLNGTTSGNNQTAGLTAARVDVDGNTTTTNSSMASLRLPAGSTVVRAYLYYQSARSTTTQPPQDNQVLFGRTAFGALPTNANYQSVTATAIENFSTTATTGFTAVADVTNIINTSGSGDYWVGNLDGYTNLGSWSGWSLVVVFSNPNQNLRNLSVNDGSAIVGVLSTISSQNVTISGFKAPNTGIFDVRIGAVAYDGDRGTADNGYLVNNVNITDSQNTTTDAFNSSITDMGVFYPPTWGKNPNHLNNLSVDIDLLSAPTPTTIPNGATTANFTVASNSETLYLQALTTSIEIAAIAGTLYRDNNNDGVFNTGDVTLPAGITVRLLNPTNNSVITTTTTAADGTYTFAQINDGNYRIQVDTTDTDIPTTVSLVTPNNLDTTLASVPINNQNFGFSPPADLSLTKTVNNSSPTVGSNVTFTLTLTNAGPNSATGVTVADLLPAGLTFVSATPSAGTTYNSGTGVWTVGTVGTTVNANTATLQIVATVATAGAKTNTAQVSAAIQRDPDSTPNNNVTTEDDQASVTVTPVVTAPDLTITKSHTGNFTQGQTGASYTLTATNSGNVATTSNVTVTDSLPTGIVPTAATGTGWTCNISGQNVSCTRTAFVALGAGSSYPAITITVSVANSITSPQTNTANITGGGETNTTNNSATDPTTINSSAVPNPIACDGNFYQVRQNTGWQLFRINRNVSPYTQTQVGNITPAITLNALGYRKADGFMYAIRVDPDTNHLYRIDQNGAVFLGAVSGLPALNYNAGSVGADGDLYVRQEPLSNTIYRINVSTLTATTITLNQSIQTADIAFSPIDGSIYGLYDNNFYRIVVSGTTGTVTNIGTSNITPTPSIGSVFFDAAGNFYAYVNSGTFYLINTTTANATQVSTAPNTSLSDGASCVFTDPERVITTVKSAGTVTTVNPTTFTVPYTVVVNNTGTDTAPNTQVTENLNLTFNTGTPTITVPSLPAVTNGSCTANPAFNGLLDTRLLLGSDTLAIGASCTISFTVQVVYPNLASVPTAVQNNTAYASSASNNPNAGYTFISGVAVPPPTLLSVAQSTVGITYSATTNAPNLLLVKRITAINGINIPGFQDGVNNPGDPNNVGVKAADDDDILWPLPNATSLSGAINSSTITPAVALKPGDEVEYTIYYLNKGTSGASNVSVCDFIPANQTYASTGFNASPLLPDSGGLAGSNYGIVLQDATGGTPVKATNAGDGDRGQFYSTGFPASCTGTNNGQGAVVVNISTIPNATSAGTPPASYGFIRFKAKVN